MRNRLVGKISSVADKQDVDERLAECRQLFDIPGSLGKRVGDHQPVDHGGDDGEYRHLHLADIHMRGVADLLAFEDIDEFGVFHVAITVNDTRDRDAAASIGVGLDFRILFFFLINLKREFCILREW